MTKNVERLPKKAEIGAGWKRVTSCRTIIRRILRKCLTYWEKYNTIVYRKHEHRFELQRNKDKENTIDGK